jgi:hypothetical protein
MMTSLIRRESTFVCMFVLFVNSKFFIIGHGRFHDEAGWGRRNGGHRIFVFRRIQSSIIHTSSS